MKEQHTDYPQPQSHHWTLEDTAASSSIPTESLEHPAVREFIQLLNRAENLQLDLMYAAEQPRSLSLARQRELFAAPDTAHSLYDRYDSAELLMRGVLHILGEGTGEPADQFRGYLRGKLRGALWRFGLDVIERQPDQRY